MDLCWVLGSVEFTHIVHQLHDLQPNLHCYISICAYPLQGTPLSVEDRFTTQEYFDLYNYTTNRTLYLSTLSFSLSTSQPPHLNPLFLSICKQRTKSIKPPRPIANTIYN